MPAVHPQISSPWDYLFHEGTRQVAILSANGFRRNAKARIGEMEYDVAREGAFSEKVLHQVGRFPFGRCRAQRASFDIRI